jgi:hypothetical protein
MVTFSDAEAEQFWHYISGSLGRLVALIEQEPDEVIRYRPPIPEANSILGLAHHTLANAADNLLGVLQGMPTDRDRETEFEDMERQGLLEMWGVLRAELESTLAELPAGALDRIVKHGWRGEIAAREVLIIVARHAAEHLGQAEITRDLAHQP